MKKLLSILAVVGLVSTASTGVVSCSRKPSFTKEEPSIAKAKLSISDDRKTIEITNAKNMDHLITDNFTTEFWIKGLSSIFLNYSGSNGSSTSLKLNANEQINLYGTNVLLMKIISTKDGKSVLASSQAKFINKRPSVKIKSASYDEMSSNLTISGYDLDGIQDSDNMGLWFEGQLVEENFNIVKELSSSKKIVFNLSNPLEKYGDYSFMYMGETANFSFVGESVELSEADVSEPDLKAIILTGYNLKKLDGNTSEFLIMDPNSSAVDISGIDNIKSKLKGQDTVKISLEQMLKNDGDYEIYCGKNLQVKNNVPTNYESKISFHFNKQVEFYAGTYTYLKGVLDPKIEITGQNLSLVKSSMNVKIYKSSDDDDNSWELVQDVAYVSIIPNGNDDDEMQTIDFNLFSPLPVDPQYKVEYVVGEQAIASVVVPNLYMD